MSELFKNITLDNIDDEHLCCAIADKKHQCGVEAKKNWLKDRLVEEHTFRKLDDRGKVFIEYAPLETAWVPINGENYLYIYCLWVSGSYKGKGYAKALLQYCIDDAKSRHKAGICVLCSKKKKPYLSDKNFMLKWGFEVVDSVGEYELLALSFDKSYPQFSDSARQCKVDNNELTVYYGNQCPYISNCIKEVMLYCQNHHIPLKLIVVDSLQKAKSVPCVFNNWAVFYQGRFETVHLLNEGYLKKLLAL